MFYTTLLCGERYGEILYLQDAGNHSEEPVIRYSSVTWNHGGTKCHKQAALH
jgi:hypothetical protein